MKHLLLAATCLSLVSVAEMSQATTYTFENPCERGPVPEWKIVNNSRAEFIAFLQQARPTMPLDVAENIAHHLCDDMSLLRDSSGLTRRVNLLISEAGY